MGEFKTKFSIGDKVFHAWVDTVRKKHPCPDCAGSRKWKAISPAGREYEFACPRCSDTYQNERALSLEYSQFGPSVRKMTIGSVRVNTADKNPVEYMCVETGVGSGTIYKETDLFATEDEATAAAEAKAALQNSTVEWVVRQYDKSLRVCDYQLSDALAKEARDSKISVSVRLQMLFDDLRDCQNNEDVVAVIERYSEREREAA